MLGVIVMNTAKRLFLQNRGLYYLALFAWIAACVCGIICAARLGGDGFDDVSTYVQDTFSSASAWKSIRLGTGENIKFLICLLAVSSAMVLMPLTVGLIVFKGFAAGFTAAVIIRIYSARGIALSFATVVLPYAFSMPLLFMMFVAALRFPLQGKDERIPPSRAEKRRQWAAYALMQTALTALLCAIGVAEAFLSQLVLKIIL